MQPWPWFNEIKWAVAGGAIPRTSANVMASAASFFLIFTSFTLIGVNVLTDLIRFYLYATSLVKNV